MEKEFDVPSIELLVTLDAEYREKARAGALTLIAPKKFNPEGKAWLPIMQTVRDGWQFTILFSNTQKAHEFGKAQDWVVIYFSRRGGERKCTVVTEFKGELAGKRVVRGREEECRRFYMHAQK